MKRILATAAALLLILACTACGEKPTDAPPQRPEIVPLLSPEQQIAQMAHQLPDLLAEQTAQPSNVFVTDLDENGKLELILSDPGFAMYEFSAEDAPLAPVAEYTAEDAFCPELYTNGSYSGIEAADGTRGIVWMNYAYSENTVEKRENIYTLADGQLTCETVRSSVYDYVGNEMTACSAAGEECDYSTFAAAMAERADGKALFNLNLGGVYADDIAGASEEAVAERLGAAWADYGTVDTSACPSYTELQGSWKLTSGEVDGGEFEVEEGDGARLTFHDGLVDLEDYRADGVTVLSEDLPLSLCVGSTYGNDLWYADLPDTQDLRYITLTLMNDGRLFFSAQIMYSEADYGSIGWYFEKE